jgi:hypothetical protein
MQKSKQNTENTLHQNFLLGNPIQEKTTEHISFCSSASTNLQFIIIHLDRNSPIIDNEETNPLRNQHVTNDEEFPFLYVDT